MYYGDNADTVTTGTEHLWRSAEVPAFFHMEFVPESDFVF